MPAAPINNYLRRVCSPAFYFFFFGSRSDEMHTRCTFDPSSFAVLKYFMMKAAKFLVSLFLPLLNPLSWWDHDFSLTHFWVG